MSINTDFTMTINGKSCSTERRFAVINPATEEIVDYAPDADEQQLNDAVDSANKAFISWRQTSLEERQQLLKKAGDIILENADQLAELFTQEQGRPLEGALMEIKEAAETYYHYAKITIPVDITEDSATRRIEVHHEPLGAICAIAPWNFPITLSTWKVAPALLTGNTVVLKPSPFTPLCSLKIGELLNRVFPAGVLNVISGNDSLGPKMTSHPGFAKVSFTGSTMTGKKIAESCAKDLKRFTLELGGNDAAIILSDVDIEAIAMQVFFGAFYNSGQICVATKRLYIHNDIYDQFRDKLIEIANTITVGNGLNSNSVLGPIQNARQYQHVKNLIEDAKAKGLTLISGKAISEEKGYFIPVTLVDNPPANSRVVKEEAFGPLLPLIRFYNGKDLIEQVNDSEYGLAASIWSNDIDHAVEIAKRLDTGTVWINQNLDLPLSTPFGGHKQSGIGVENGLAGLLGFTAAKSLYIPK